MQDKWENLDKALAMFEPEFHIERNQDIQESREPLDAFAEPSAGFILKKLLKLL